MVKHEDSGLPGAPDIVKYEGFGGPGAPDTVKYEGSGPPGAPDTAKYEDSGPPGAPDTVKYEGLRGPGALVALQPLKKSFFGSWGASPIKIACLAAGAFHQLENCFFAPRGVSAIK